MVAEGNAVMVKFNLCRAADTISRSRDAAMYLCQLQGLASPDGIHNTSEHNRAENDCGNASHFEDAKLARIECHAGIIGASTATSIDLNHARKVRRWVTSLTKLNS